MPSTVYHADTLSLPGPPPDHLFTHPSLFSDQLAILHSATNRGHSVIALHPLLTITPTADSPLDHLSRQLNSIALDIPATDSPLVGFLGYISYDIARLIEDIGTHAIDDAHWPLFRFQLFADYLLYAHDTRTWTLIALQQPSLPPTSARLENLRRILDTATPSTPVIPPATLTASLPRETYLSHIARIKDYISAGDIYQANYAQRWTARTAAAPHHLFAALCRESPAEFAALFIDGPRSIISASPELFLQRRGSHVSTRPIKGTRPRDPANSARDAVLRDDLLNSSKDKAELAMIVDLLRNDLGRVAEFGSVRVTAPRSLEAHPTVWHTTATIDATLRPDTTWADILRAACPGGSITGAPKIRAMQIIEELEPHRRHIYCGHLGAIRPNATGTTDATLNIAIRTIQLLRDTRQPKPTASTPPSPKPTASTPLSPKPTASTPWAPTTSPPALASSPTHTAHIWAGGGIVADSDPVKEYEETLHKAAAMLRALNLEPSAAEQPSTIARGGSPWKKE